MTTFIAACRSPGEALNTKVTNCRPQTRSTDAATGGGDQRRFILPSKTRCGEHWTFSGKRARIAAAISSICG